MGHVLSTRITVPTLVCVCASAWPLWSLSCQGQWALPEIWGGGVYMHRQSRAALVSAGRVAIPCRAPSYLPEVPWGQWEWGLPLISAIDGPPVFKGWEENEMHINSINSRVLLKVVQFSVMTHTVIQDFALPQYHQDEECALLWGLLELLINRPLVRGTADRWAYHTYRDSRPMSLSPLQQWCHGFQWINAHGQEAGTVPSSVT